MRGIDRVVKGPRPFQSVHQVDGAGITRLDVAGFQQVNDLRAAVGGHGGGAQAGILVHYRGDGFHNRVIRTAHRSPYRSSGWRPVRPGTRRWSIRQGPAAHTVRAVRQEIAFFIVLQLLLLDWLSGLLINRPELLARSA